MSLKPYKPCNEFLDHKWKEQQHLRHRQKLSDIRSSFTQPFTPLPAAKRNAKKEFQNQRKYPPTC